MPTITGYIRDSLRSGIRARLLTDLSVPACRDDTIFLPSAIQEIAAGVQVSIAPAANLQLIPDGTTFTFVVQDTGGNKRQSAAGVSVTAVMDTLDDIL